MEHSSSFLFKKITQNILLALIAFFPIFFISENILQLTSFKTFLIAIGGSALFIGILILKIKQNSFSFTKNIYILSMCGILVSMLLSVFFSDASHISFIGRQVNMYSFSTIFSLCALAYVVYTLFKEKNDRKKLLATIFISSVSVVVLHTLFVLIPFLPSAGFFLTNISNTIGALSHLGIFIVFTIISSILVLYFFANKKIYKIFAYIGIISGLTLLSIINMWSLFFILAIFCFLHLILQILVLEPTEKEENHISYPSLIVFIFSIVFILIGSKVGLILNTAFTMQSVEVHPTILNTLLITKDVIQNESITHKLFGVGLDRFNVAWFQYRPIELNTTQFWDTDFRSGYSFISSVGVTQGAVGIFAWLVFVIFSILYVIKVYKKSTEHSSANFIHVYTTTGLLFFLLVLLISNPSIVLFALFFVFLGLFIRTLCELEIISFKEYSIVGSPRKSFLYILTIVILLISAVYVLYGHVAQYSSNVIASNATKNFNQDNDVSRALQKLEQAQFLFNTDIYTIARTDLALFELNKILSDTTLNQEQATAKFSQILQSIATLNQQVIMYDTKSYANYLYILNIYKSLASLGVEDAAPQAIQIIDQVSTFVPNNPTLSLQKAQTYVIVKDFDRAVQYTQEALSLKPNYIQAAFLLSQIQVEKGEINEAISSIRAIIAENPFEPTLYFQLGLLQYNQTKYSDAILSFKDALTLSPEFNNAKYFLGLSQYKNNQTSEAVTLFESLNQSFPDNQEVKQILSNMKSGINALSGIQEESVEEVLPVEEVVVSEE